MTTSIDTPGHHRILIIDDNPAIHEDFRKILCGGDSTDRALEEAEAALFGGSPETPKATELSSHFEMDSAYQGQEGLEMVQRALEAGRPYSMAFVDVRMPPGWDGIETVKQIWQQYPELQVVICTAYSDYSWEEMFKQVGQTDNLLILKKPFDNVEVLQLAHALTQKWLLTQKAKSRLQDLDRLVNQRTAELEAANAKLRAEMAERQKIEDELRSSKERFSKAFHSSPIPMAIQRFQGEHYLDINAAFLKVMDLKREEVIGSTPSELNIWMDTAARERMLKELRERGSVRNLECRLQAKSKQIRHVFLSAELFDLGVEPNILSIAEDVSDRLKLEQQLWQAQKMEAVGQLAAGIAHDFNNILTIIQGHVSLRLAAKDLEHKAAESFRQVADVTERAAHLTRQLLAFSSKQVMQPRVLDVNKAVGGMQKILVRAVGEQIALECDFASEGPAIEADEGNIEQALLNLVVNARDAMLPDGGKLTIRTEVVEVKPAELESNPQARVGRFVCLSVVDTGCGMEENVLSRIFEPFFTTKEVGKGTGLGLSMVYGIVKQHRGWIEVESCVGKGSTFKVFLPAGEKEPEVVQEEQLPAQPVQGGERVLVVEDEQLLRELVREVLTQNGYEVVEAIDGVEALQLWKQQGGSFEVLVTDMIMPNNLGGRELAETLRKDKPSLKVIFTTGYSSEMFGKDFVASHDTRFLQKPYKPDLLLQAVRQCLEGPHLAGSLGHAA